MPKQSTHVKILNGLADLGLAVDATPIDDCFSFLHSEDIDVRSFLNGDYFTLIHTPTGMIAGQAGSKSELERFVAMLRTTDIDWSIADIGHYHSADVLEKSRAVRQQWLGAQ